MYNDPNQNNPSQPNLPPYNPNQPYQPPYNPAQPGQPYQQQPYPQNQPYPPGFPAPGMMPPPKKKHTLRNIIIGLVIVVVLCGVVGIISNSAAKNNGTVVAGSTTTASTTTTATKPATTSTTHFKVGQAVKVGDWQVTVNSVKTSQGSAYVKPTKGQFLLLDVSVVNTSSSEQAISSLLNFKLMDSTGLSYTETFAGTDVPNPPDGKVESGSPSRGTFTYDVPTSMKAYTFVFEPDITASGESIWDIKP